MKMPSDSLLFPVVSNSCIFLLWAAGDFAQYVEISFMVRLDLDLNYA